VLSVPSDLVEYQRVALGEGAEEAMAEAVHELMASLWDVDRKSLCVDRIAIPSVPDGPMGNHIAVVASAEDIHRHAQLAREMGLSPVAIDTAAGAIARCIVPVIENSARGILLVVVTDDRRTLAIVQDDAIAFITATRDVRSWNASSAPQRHGSSHGQGAPGAHRATRSVGAAAASDLSIEVNALLHYLGDEGLGHLIPEHGVVVGGDEHELIVSLSDACPLRFVELDTILHPIARLALAEHPARATVEDVVIAAGLAMYGHEHLMEDALDAAHQSSSR